jgi:hypothetical protein
MGKGRVGVYDFRTEELRSQLFPWNPYTPNKIYITPHGVRVYCNTKGYIHVLKPFKLYSAAEGMSFGWDIIDIMLRPDGTEKKELLNHRYQTVEACFDAIDKFFD